jgi:hypothetical protein
MGRFPVQKVKIGFNGYIGHQLTLPNLKSTEPVNRYGIETLIAPLSGYVHHFDSQPLSDINHSFFTQIPGRFEQDYNHLQMLNRASLSNPQYRIPYHPQQISQLSFSEPSSTDKLQYSSLGYQNYSNQPHFSIHDLEYYSEKQPPKVPKLKIKKSQKSESPTKSPKADSPTGANRSKTSQYQVVCSRCTSEVGYVYIRGKREVESGCPEMRFWCTLCDENPFQASNKGKKRISCSDKVDCDVCKTCIGSGGVFSDEGDMKVEYVCKDCGDKYLFCSECGGGGKQRTGKWRPKELFEKARRTCSLPHIRVGTVDIQYKILRVNEITSEILAGIQEVFFDCYLSIYCVPSLMGTSAFSSFGLIREMIEHLWKTTVLNVIMKVDGKNKYITLASILKRHRNKGVNRRFSSSPKEANSWLQRLDIWPSCPDMPKGLEFDDYKKEEIEQHHCYVAFSVFEWNIQNETIFISQLSPRSVFLKTMEGYLEIIRKTVEQIRLDASLCRVQPPKILWCWAKTDHAKLQSIPPRLRFSLKSTFLSANPQLDPSILKNDDYEPLNSRGGIEFAGMIDTILPLI